MKDAVLVLDIGTSNVRAALIDPENGALCASLSQESSWQALGNGAYEMDPEQIWNALQDVLAGLLDQTRSTYRPICISFSMMGDSLIPVDENGQPLRPMMMAFDTRAGRESDELIRLLGAERFRSITGGDCCSMLLCAKILWLRRHEPEIFRKTARFLNIQEYLLLRMGLAPATDYTLACRKSLLDVRTKQFSPDLAAAVGITAEQCGSRVLPAATVLAEAERIGRVALSSPVPVVLGAHDAECGFLGLGIDDAAPDVIGNVCGTYQMLGSFLTGIQPRRLTPPAELGCAFTADGNCLNGSSIAGRYISWFQTQICRSGAGFFSEMEEALHFDASSPVKFLLRNDMPGCAFWGFDTSTPLPVLYQALIEAITFRLKDVLDAIERTAGHSFRAISCGGGSARSDKWLQFKADLMQKEVRRVCNPEASAVGAAMLGAVGSGYYSSFPEAAKRMVRIADVFHPSSAIGAAYAERMQEYRRVLSHFFHTR